MIEFPSEYELNKIVFLGDMHCNYEYTVKAIYYAGRNGAQVIIQVGDFGYNYPDGFLNVVQDACERNNLILMFVDGNHENFNWLLEQPVSSDGVRRLRERVWHLPRNFRWTWQGVKFHALGGASSVDRQARVPMVSWWPQEYITSKDFDTAINNDECDVMICHDAPTQAPVPLGNNSWIPDIDLNLAISHRAVIQDIVDILKPKLFVHGHYHVRYQEMVGNTKYIGLDCDGTPFKSSILFVNISDLKKLDQPLDNS